MSYSQKKRVSPLITPILLPYIIPYITSFRSLDYSSCVVIRGASCVETTRRYGKPSREEAPALLRWSFSKTGMELAGREPIGSLANSYTCPQLNESVNLAVNEPYASWPPHTQEVPAPEAQRRTRHSRPCMAVSVSGSTVEAKRPSNATLRYNEGLCKESRLAYYTRAVERCHQPHEAENLPSAIMDAS